MGFGFADNAAGFRAGRTAFRPVTAFDVARQRVGTAGEVNVPPLSPGSLIGRRDWERMDRGTRLAWWAAHEAMESAGLNGGFMPIVVGTSAAAMPIGEDYFKRAVEVPGRRAGQVLGTETYKVQGELSEVAGQLG